MLIEWKPEFAVGIARIDEQHQQLVSMLNSLYLRVGPDINAAEVWPLLTGFNQYADTHFKLEERLARECGIDARMFKEHCVAHQEYVERMRKFGQALTAGDKYAAIQLMSFLASWWAEHICESDRELGSALRKSGLT